jgi:nucleoside phosphorylase
MTDLTFDDPCVLFALRREARPFLREFRPHQRFPGAPCWARFCGYSWLTVLVLQTGVGRAAMESALGWVLSRPLLDNVPYRPKLVLSAGFAGSVQENYRVGDIILASEVIDVEGKPRPATWPGQLPAGEWRPPLHRGRLFTASGLIGTPDEKRELGRRYEAAAVDMESGVAARLCTERQVPFGCVRVISDSLETAISRDVAELVWEGRVAWLRLLAALVRCPGLLGELWRLASETRYAARQLGTALGELLTLTLPEAE